MGADVIVFRAAPMAGNEDLVTDFTDGEDLVYLDLNSLTGLSLVESALDEAWFQFGTAALDADDRILYDTLTGALYYDADGADTVAGAAQLFSLSGAPMLDHADFFVFNALAGNANSAGNDQQFGTDGDDTFTGGLGNDTIYQSDQVAMVQYMNALQSYQDEVKGIQDQFRSDMNQYRSQADLYTAEMKEYQTAKISYDAARSTAINSAESVIESHIDIIGWAFVKIRDMSILIPWIINTWIAQLVIIGVYFILILAFIKRKDASA